MNPENDVILVNSQFGRALRLVRDLAGVPQEAFDLVSSRTYVSALERGIKQPTLPKVDELAALLEVHPLTLLTLCYVSGPQHAPFEVLETVAAELEVLKLLAADS